MLAGLSLGLAILTRPVAQMLPLRHGRGFGAALLAAVLFFGAATAPLTPLLYRNFSQFGALALSSQTGNHVIGWVVPLIRRAEDGTPREIGATKLMAEALARTRIDDQKPEDLNYFDQSQAFTKIGLEAIGRYSASAVVMAWAKGAAINLAAIAIDIRVRGLPHPSFDRTHGDTLVEQVTNFLSGSSFVYVAIIAGGLLLSVVFLILQEHGFLVLARTAPWIAFLASLCLGYFLAVNGPIGSPKYRLPFEPVLIVLSALSLTETSKRLRGK